MPLSKDELLREMNAAGVHRVVIVPPYWEGDYNDLALEAARLHPDRFAVMGRLDIDAPGAHDRIVHWREQPGMLGLRLTFRSQGNPADDGLWSAAEAGSVPVMTGVRAGRFPTLAQAASRHPRLRLVLDHFGLIPGTQDDMAFAHMDAMLPLAKYPNIAVKASALPCYTSDSYPYRRLHPYIRRVYDAFGPRRIFWGSDFSRLPCSYRQAVTMFTEEIPWLTAEDKQWIMGRALCEWLGWPIPGTA